MRHKLFIMAIVVFLWNGTAYAGIILKIVGVNPSATETQIVPMKAYLPSGIRPEDVIYANGMSVDYDPALAAYYLYEEIEVKPNEKIVKEVEIKDIWVIPEDELNDLSSKANRLFKELENTKSKEKGKEVIEEIMAKLENIMKKQTEKLSPKEHISAYQDNKEIMRSIKDDILFMEKLLTNIEEDTGKEKQGKKSGGLFQFDDEDKKGGISGLKKGIRAIKGKMQGFFMDSKEVLNETNEVKASRNLIWKVILFIVVFLGIISSFFFFLWYYEVERLKKENYSEEIPEGEKIAERK